MSPSLSAPRALRRASAALLVLCVARPAPAQRRSAVAEPAGTATLATLDAIAAGAGPPAGVAIPEARSFCGSPRERPLRARIGAALPSCEARESRLTLRAVDRIHDRLDARWVEEANGARRVRRRTWIVRADDEVFAMSDARLVALRADAPRGPWDALRAALLSLADDGCDFAWDDPPAGLGAAGARLPTGVYGDPARGYRALVWAACPSTTSTTEGAVRFTLQAVEPSRHGPPRMPELVRYCVGEAGCPRPPQR